jgi:hypothetical protein
MTALGGTLAILALLVVPYVRPWISQRSQLTDGQAQVEQLRREVADLKAERARWNDPAYVKAQARQRLHYVLPGETGYVVLDDRQKVTRSVDPRQVAAAVPTEVPGGSTSAWYAKVWQSIQIAGDPGTESAVDGDGLVVPLPSITVLPVPTRGTSATSTR